MSNLTVNTITPSSTSEVELQGLNPPTYLGSTLAEVSDVVLKVGSTMTGHLTLNANASANMHAVPKQQLDTALTNFTVQSQSMPGYQKFPGGLIMQWTTVNIPNVSAGVPGDTGTISWPLAPGSGGFQSACVAVLVSVRVPAGQIHNITAAATSYNTTGVTYLVQESGAIANECNIDFLAIGY
jgi:hypothetical protein